MHSIWRDTIVPLPFQIKKTSISAFHFDREKPEGKSIVICGEDFIILPSDETKTKLYYDTPSGAYTITVRAEDHMAIALQVAEDLLTAE